MVEVFDGRIIQSIEGHRRTFDGFCSGVTFLIEQS
jgi:hypothetical protein